MDELVVFYENVLCLPSPWHVVRVACFAEARRVDVWIDHDASLFHCPECMGEYAVFDHLPERTWRHLDTCGFQTFLHARLPRVKCALDGKVHRMGSVRYAADFRHGGNGVPVHKGNAGMHDAGRGKPDRGERQET